MTTQPTRRAPSRRSPARSGEDTRPRYSMSRPEAEELLAWIRDSKDDYDDEILERVDGALAKPIVDMPRHEDMRVLLAMTLAEVVLVRQILADTTGEIDGGERGEVIAGRLEKQIERSKRYEAGSGDQARRRSRRRGS